MGMSFIRSIFRLGVGCTWLPLFILLKGLTVLIYWGTHDFNFCQVGDQVILPQGICAPYWGSLAISRATVCLDVDKDG